MNTELVFLGLIVAAVVVYFVVRRRRIYNTGPNTGGKNAGTTGNEDHK